MATRRKNSRLNRKKVESPKVKGFTPATNSAEIRHGGALRVRRHLVAAARVK